MRVTKKLVLAVVAGLVALALIVGAVLWAVPVLQVDEVAVKGNRQLQPAQVEEATGVSKGENLLRVNAREAAAGAAQLPWVDTATVSRSLPGTVVVELTERQAVAFRNDGGKQLLIDARGQEFDAGEPPKEAVEITGTAESGSAELTAAVEAIAALPEHLRPQVRSLKVDGADSLTFLMEDERTVFWGSSGQDNSDKALAMETALKMDGKHWDISNPSLVTKR